VSSAVETKAQETGPGRHYVTSAPGAPDPARPLRVLFVHPAYPNQFTDIGAELDKDPGFVCYGLVHQEMGPAVAAAGTGIPHFGFLPDGAPAPNAYSYLTGFEEGLRNARGIVQTLLAIQPGYQFDAIVGHAGFGATLYLKTIQAGAIISYAELPSYQAATARREFPLPLETQLAGTAVESLIYTSLLRSDLGIVPSEHAKRYFPPELQSKIRVQMEGFAVTEVPPGGAAERAALGLPLDTPLVGFFGRTLEAARGFDIFVQVARRLHEADPSLHFLVVGDEQTIYGNEQTYTHGRSFKTYTLERAGVPESLFHWRATLPYDLFRRHIGCLDLAILPLFEGAGNWNLFEAMATGLPILAANRCFVPEAIRDGQEGCLLDAYDVNGFVAQAQRLLADRVAARRLGQAAQARIREHYSPAAAAAGYRRIILEALSRHRAARAAGAARL
jgi:glycosyltransferase involved in cell wall biosynthesis